MGAVNEWLALSSRWTGERWLAVRRCDGNGDGMRKWWRAENARVRRQRYWLFVSGEGRS